MTPKKKTTKKTVGAVRAARLPTTPRAAGGDLLLEVRGLILSARENVARAVNAGLTLLYWEIGNRTRRDVLQEKRAEYGERIVSALRTQLGWTHFRQIIALGESLKRDFYAEMCRIERWSTRTLDKKIGGMLFERTALSKKPAKLAAMELKQLRQKLHEAVIHARARMGSGPQSIKHSK